MHKGRVLIIAGSDSGGGAGIQADIKSVTMQGGYAATAITALTAQNTKGVFGVMDVPPEFIEQQINLVLEDIGADVIKTGMLHNVKVIESVVKVLEGYPEIPIVVDPVMVATSGDSLLQSDAVYAMKSQLIARAFLVTPNIPEAEVLSGRSIKNIDDMRQSAKAILAMGAGAVLLKGGHGVGNKITDLLLMADGSEYVFENDRIESNNTHGTGCTLASAIACNLAKGIDLEDAVGRSILYVREAIKASDGFGCLKHNYNVN